MKKLRMVLSEWSEAPQLGDLGKRKEPDGDKLKAEIRRISDQNKVYFSICFLLLVLLFIGAAALVVFSLSDPGRVKSILAASGISFFGITTQMLKLWKEKVASDLTLTLISNLNPREIKPTIEILLRGLR